jgi:hypothetical protein
MLARAITLFTCFVGASFLIGHAAHTEETPIRTPLSQLPMTLESWRGVREPPFANRVLEVLGVDDYLTRGYFRSSQSGVGLYIGYYRSQRQGETIHSPLNCLPGSGWEPVSRTTIRIPIDQDSRVNKVDSAAVVDRSAASFRSEPSVAIAVNRYVVQKGLDREIVLYWYQSHGRVVANEYLSRFYLVADAIRLNRTDAAMVRVIAPIPSNVEDGEARAERDAVQFIEVLFPHLSNYLPA